MVGNYPVAVRVGTDTDWSAVACGDEFSLAIKSDGSLWSWGLNANSQLGLGDTADRSTPQQVGSASDWAGVAGGDKHALAVKDDGSLWSWGLNANGQLGLGDTDDRTTPAQVGSDTDWDEISGGADFSAAVKAGGTLWTWGRNNRSQLGLGDTVQQLSPQQVGAGADWASVRCGDEDAMAITSAGALWSWGYNSFGQLGLGDSLIRTEPTQVGADVDWVEFARGDDHAAAIKDNGTLWAWGDNNYGQLGLGTSDNSAHPAPTQVGNGRNWSRVLCGDDFTTALRPGDELWGCGDNTSGDLSLGFVTLQQDSPTLPTLLFITSDATAPTLDTLTSSTHPVASVWYPLADASFAWTGADASGIAGYRWIRDQVAGTAAPTGYPNPGTSVPYTGLADGLHYFHVRAVDRAGNWGATSTRAARIDTTPPSVTPVRPVDGATYLWGSTVTSSWTSDDVHSGLATETAILDGTAVGKGDALDTAATGAHTFAITATDAAGNQQAVSLAYSVEPPLTFTITPTAGPNGSISPATPQTVDSGGSQAFTITPAGGYHVADVLVDGNSVGAVPSYTFTNVTADHIISATFAVDVFTITPTAGPNGSISPATPQTVDSGGSRAFTITPASGYHVADVLVDGASIGTVTSHTFTNVTADHTISALFAIDVFTITPTAGPNGAISPSTPQTVDSGGSQAFTITPAGGYHVADVLVDGVSVGAVTSYTFSNVTADHTISATFAIDMFTITPTPPVHGFIRPGTEQSVAFGENLTFEIEAADGYYVADVTVDGASVGPVTSYSFLAIDADHTIGASFALGPQAEPRHDVRQDRGHVRRLDHPWGQALRQRLRGRSGRTHRHAGAVRIGRRAFVEHRGHLRHQHELRPGHGRAVHHDGLADGTHLLPSAVRRRTAGRVREPHRRPPQARHASGADPARRARVDTRPSLLHGLRVARAALHGRPEDGQGQGVPLQERPVRLREDARRHQRRQRRLHQVPAQDQAHGEG